METENVEPITIMSLNDDCLEAIFKYFNTNVQHEIGYHDGIDYTDILFQLKIARSCKRFCNIFIDTIWKSKEKHLTLRPQQLYRTLGPINTAFYMKAMQESLIKLELEENYIPWFLAQAETADIDAFPCISTCVLKNSFAKPVKARDIEQLSAILLPNLLSLSLTTAVKENYFAELKALQELNFSCKSPMDFSYFQTICSTLQNLRVLNITAPLRFEDQVIDDDDDGNEVTPLISSLPENLQVLVLNVTAASTLLAAIFKLKKLEKLIITILSNQSLSENVLTVNAILIEKSQMLRGFGLNKMFDSALRVWNFPKCVPQLKNVRKFSFSAYENVPPLIDLKRLICMSNLNAICLKNCFIIQNDTVLRLVKLTKKLQDLDISGCYLLDAETLLIDLFQIRSKQTSKGFSAPRPLSIYTDENLDIKIPEFWKMQQLIVKGENCPIDVDETGFVFDFV